ncbi:amidase family protein [Paenibacillus koleovorans]|uniref:amidase family protein n=1 Tax=Paenibacillus koleovorans TaxID=121608 RepID=UPI000FD7E920|nr:amidase family protein [Paenibacillus koleovorans]
MQHSVDEMTIAQLQRALADGTWTSRRLTIAYMERIAEVDRSGATPLNAVLELNPDALYIAERMDQERAIGRVRGPLHGIPILLKDNISTADKLHTSAGSLALANSYAPSDAHLANLLREAGAVILGKANMTEFANFMTSGMPNGYSSRGGQVLNPYGPGRFPPGGSSSGSAVAVAASLCAVAVGTETSGSILNPAHRNALVGIKPTLGLISRSGIVPISYTQDTAGPLARTVEDAAILLGAMAGIDEDDETTLLQPERIRQIQDYTRFLDAEGLNGARIGINRGYIGDFSGEEQGLIESAIRQMKEAGAVIVEGTDLPHIAEKSSVLLQEFKSALNRYLFSLGPSAPVKSLRDIIAFNNEHPQATLKFGQKTLLQAEYETTGTMTEPAYIRDRLRDWKASREEGIDRLFAEHRLDALFCPGVTDSPAVSGYPAVMVPAGFRKDGMPFGVSFAGPAYSEPMLLRLAYAFEQKTKARRAPLLMRMISE